MHGLIQAFMRLTGAVVISAAMLCVGLAQAQPRPVPQGKPNIILPAANVPSPEEQMQKKLPQAAKPEEIDAHAKVPAEQHCMQNSKCRAKLEHAIQKKPPLMTLPPASGPSLEEQMRKSLPAPPQGPHGRIPGPIERFFSWLDPFVPGSAWAQGTIPSSKLQLSPTGTYVLTLTPSNRVSGSPYGFISLYGGIQWKDSPYALLNQITVPSSDGENKPYVYMQVNIPAAGYYMIDITASPSILKLRHANSGTILDTWDFASKSCGSSTLCHYQTVDYYAGGYHYWYFWVEPKHWGANFYSVTIKKPS